MNTTQYVYVQQRRAKDVARQLTTKHALNPRLTHYEVMALGHPRLIPSIKASLGRLYGPQQAREVVAEVRSLIVTDDA